MKFLMTGIVVLIASSAFAATPAQDCLKVKNSLDRKYCLDKYLETVKDAHASEKKSWGAGLAAADKDTKTSSMEESIAAKKEYINLMQSEISLDEKQLEALKATPVAATAAPAPKKEKKKKKGGFRIKL
jgi:hypothetical protein